MSKRNLGSHFDKFLEDEDLLEDASAVAIKRVIARQMVAVMKKKGLRCDKCGKLLRGNILKWAKILGAKKVFCKKCSGVSGHF